MEITSTRARNGTARRKQTFNGLNGNRESQKSSILNKRAIFYQHQQTLSTIKVIFWITILANSAVETSACPSSCSCAVEATAFCNNKGLNKTPLGFTTSIEKVYLFNNNITRILPSTLQPLKNLKLLDLSGNRITNYALWKNVFNRLSLLENLMLQENQITRIEEGMFKGLTNLARIYLQDNQISTIEDGAFDNLTNLVELKLRNNELSSFPRLRNTPNLLLLDLGYNKLSSIRDLTLSTVNLEHLKLQGNRLTQLRTSVFDDTSRLTHLDISNNRLTAVPLVIKSLTSLRFLNMSNNKVGSIAADTFRKMNRLKVLDLHGMELKSLPFGIVPPRVILNVWDITDNPWNCGCPSHWLPEYIRIFEGAFVQPGDIKCSTSSKLRGRALQDLTESDFECTDKEKEMTLLPTTRSTTTTRHRPTKQPWSANPCEVYPCFNGGTCYISGHHPKCRCADDWAGAQCQHSLRATSPTRITAKITTTKMTGGSFEPKPQLLINKDSITAHSVEIILPQAETELRISVSEIGQDQKSKELTIKPMAHPFTVLGLESGKSYNICIHLPLRGRKDNLPPYIDATDTLCGSVQTVGIRVINTPMVPTKIRVVSSPGIDTKYDESTENGQKDTKKRPVEHQPGVGGHLYDENNVETTATEGTDFKIVYPVIAAGIGGIIIITLIVVFFICYRRRKRKNQEIPDYLPGSPLDANQMTDMEMATVVHHHHHNHYNAEPTQPNNKTSPKTQNGLKKKKNKHQNSGMNNNSTPKSVPPNKTSSLGGRSDSRNSEASQNRYQETQQRFTGHQYMAHTPPIHPPHEQIPAQMNGSGNGYVYLNPQNNNPTTMQMLSNHGVTRGQPYNPELLEDMQPLVGGMTPYPYSSGEGQIYTEAYPISPHNEYLPPVTRMPLSYSQGNSRSAFQPIQSPRKNSARTPTSESGMITTHANTAQVFPTSTCLNMNSMSDVAI